MKIKYNSPIILSYSLISLAALLFSSNSLMGQWFTSPSNISLSNPLFYLRSIAYIFGHASWSHLMGNLTLILLVGPLLEEKVGSSNLLEMICITAISTAILNALLFSSSLIGGSGIAFMLILLSSFSNIKSGEIPLTFILVAILFIGGEVVSIIKADSISQFSHIFGGFVGACYGLLRKVR
ncbi:Peptidase S54, rhomboid domain protein [Desulfamplus magnetovallimortis]|uniref:Peptidase S54, rhomboid domain protein n=1 Tax=Desulfamplus magnetovallimortis TaxID=1246637 RepID=A0A1W1HEL9_9BACT|nr:rhomboid family intramembrane serine protease [Desulfamplus magnetovallimortis]SLM30937.1 Peptidase S54, rhomboid domain protein [Desulfamplus magnetovallimortis]